MSLPLVCLDFKERRARRYWPKPDGRGFETWDAELCAPEDQDSTLPEQIEAFRKGPEKKKPVPMCPA